MKTKLMQAQIEAMRNRLLDLEKVLEELTPYTHIEVTLELLAITECALKMASVWKPPEPIKQEMH